MGASIETVTSAASRMPRGYLRTGSKAIMRCLDQSSIAPENIGMIINTGVYPDRFIQEPAFSTLLQGKQKALQHPLNQTFSFDLHGGDGMIMAMRILDGFLESEKISGGIVVAGDSIKGKNLSGQFRYDSYAGAVVLAGYEKRCGFVAFHQDAYPEYLESFSSLTKNVDGNLLTVINQSDKYLEQCVGCAEISTNRFLRKVTLRLSDIDLIITSQDPPGLPDRLDGLFLGERVVLVNGKKQLYSAGLVFALEQAIKKGRFINARNILFLTVGAGIMVNLALYVNNR
jgi:3-oxoacyl-[acyl-carrier-protein] synthase-3